MRPKGMHMSAQARVAAEDGDQQDYGEHARADHGATPLKKLPRAVVGFTGAAGFGDRRD